MPTTIVLAKAVAKCFG